MNQTSERNTQIFTGMLDGRILPGLFERFGCESGCSLADMRKNYIRMANELQRDASDPKNPRYKEANKELPLLKDDYHVLKEVIDCMADATVKESFTNLENTVTLILENTRHTLSAFEEYKGSDEEKNEAFRKEIHRLAVHNCTALFLHASRIIIDVEGWNAAYKKLVSYENENSLDITLNKKAIGMGLLEKLIPILVDEFARKDLYTESDKCMVDFRSVFSIYGIDADRYMPAIHDKIRKSQNKPYQSAIIHLTQKIKGASDMWFEYDFSDADNMRGIRDYSENNGSCLEDDFRNLARTFTEKMYAHAKEVKDTRWKCEQAMHKASYFDSFSKMTGIDMSTEKQGYMSILGANPKNIS